MQNVLDHIFSSSWMLMAIFFVLLIITSIIAYGTNFFKNKILNWLYKSVLVILPFSPIILGMFIPIKYGFSEQIPIMYITNDKLCLLDKKQAGDEGGNWDEYRLHVLNANTGEQISRKFYKDIYDIGAIHGDTMLLYSYWHFILVDIKTNNEIKTISKEYLQSKFTELSLGIESMNYSKRDFDVYAPLVITITSKTAKTYYYEPFSDKLLSEELTRTPASLTYYLKDKEIYSKDAKNNEERMVSLDYTKGSNKIKHLKFTDEALNNSSEITKLDLLEPQIIALFFEQKTFVVVSYETTDKLNFILHAISLEGKEKWTIKQSELNLTDKYTIDPKLDAAINYSHNLIFSCGGFVVSMDINTGKVNWKKRV